MTISRREALLSLAAPLQARRPNVLMIVADDLGWGDLAGNGQKRFRTPNLDKLASEGLRCTDAYSGNPVCPRMQTRHQSAPSWRLHYGRDVPARGLPHGVSGQVGTRRT